MIIDSVLVTLAVVVAPLLTAAPPVDGCLPAGGHTVPPAKAPAGAFRITGGGWGHGAGMSQYGAQGAARLGCDADTILETYYPGADVAWAPTPERIRVSLDTEATSTAVTSVAGSIPWEICDDGGCTPLDVSLRQGRTWVVKAAAAGAYVVTEDGREIWRGGAGEARLRARLSQTDDDVRIIRIEDTYRWGALEFDAVARPRPQMFVTIEIAPFDRYLYGLDEMPSSWPRQALEAQVIAARSYAIARHERYGGQRRSCRCDVRASQWDQVYTGYEKEREGWLGGAGRRWRAAVDATHSADFSAARVLRYGDRTVEAFYSSSHGGHSESSWFVFGRQLPYIQPVDDSRWELASGNPRRVWAITLGARQLGEALGVGRALEVILPGRSGAGCRVGHPLRGYGGVVVRGTAGRRVVSGEEFRSALGLRSTLFAVNADQHGGCPDGGPASAEPALPPGRPRSLLR